MKNKIFILIASILFLISFVSATSPPPTRFWGFGDIVRGDSVEAYDIDGILCGKSIIEHEGRYVLDCSGDDPATSEDEGANNNEKIIFKVNGQVVEVSEEAIWNSGEFKQIDLILEISENETIIPDEIIDDQDTQETTGESLLKINSNQGESEENIKTTEDESSIQVTSKITGGVIGVGKKIIKGSLYFIGIIFIIFIALRLFIRIKRKTKPKEIRIIKYSDWIKQKRNKGEIKFIILFLFGIFLLINFVSAAQPPDCRMYSDAGGVIINAWNGNGDLAPIGTIVTAYDAEGTLRGNVTITTAGQFIMSISGNDPATSEDEGAEEGDTIIFYLDGDNTTAYGNNIWNSAEFHKVNLTSTNHAPEIDSMTGPSGVVLGGSSKVVSVTSHDDNHPLGIPDQVKIYVCKTNSASDNAGCVTGQKYCSSGLTADDPSCSFNVEADDSSHNYYVFVMDEHGRISGSTTTFPGSYTSDSTPPTIDSFSPSNDSWTNDSTPLITLNTNENSFCKYSNISETGYTSKTSMSGTGTSHTVTFPDMGADGTYNYYFQCNDTVGNLMILDDEYNYTIKLDSVIPFTDTNYTGNDTWFNTTQYVWLNFTDASPSSEKDWMKYCLTSECNPSSGTNYTGTVSVSSEQITYFRYASKDVAGNVEATKELIIKIDNTAPTTTDDYSYNGIWYNDDANITLNENCDISGCNWTKYCKEEGCTPDTIYIGGTIDFSKNGTLRYHSLDNAGNLQDIQETTILIDKQIPTITDDYAYDDIWINESSGNITFTLGDTGGSGLRADPASMMYCIGAGCIPDTNLSAPYTISSVTTETNSIYHYQSYDIAGSGSIIGNFTIKIDKSAPNTSDDYSYNDTWINQDAHITLTPSDYPVNNAGINSTKYCTDTDGTCIPDTVYTEGTINFTNNGIFYLRYYSTDNVNNSQDFQTVKIKIDKTNVSVVNASVSIENGSIYSTNTTLNFNYSGFEDQAELSGISGYYYNYTDNKGTTSGIWDTDLNGLLTGASQGNITIFVWAKDNAGNIGSSVNDSIIVDSINPDFTNWNNTAIIMSDTIPMKINVTVTDATSGVDGLPGIRYKYGNEDWSNWTNMSLVVDSNYTFDIPNPTWYDYYNENISWQINAKDIAGNSVNSSIQSYLIGSGEPEPIIIKKNIEYQNQTDFNITYLVTDEIYNTLNDTAISGVVFADRDINSIQDIFDLVKGEIKTRQNYLTISKDALNKDHTFATASAVWSGNTFTSNIPSISIPGYGGPFDIEVDAPASIAPSTLITADIDLINMNLDVSKDVIVNYWITDTNNNTILGLEGQKTVLANSLETTSTTGSLTSPSSPGTYRFWAKVTWVTGMTADAFDSFVVATADTGGGGSDGGSSGGRGSDGGSSGGTVTTPTEESELSPEQLLDIKLELASAIIDNANELSSVITFKSFGNVPTPVDLTYSILDSSGMEVYSEKGNVTVTTEEIVRKNFESLNLPAGKYTLVLTTVYGDNVEDEFRQDFEIRKMPSPICKPDMMWWIVLVIILCVLLVYVFLKMCKHYDVSEKRKDKLKVMLTFLLLVLTSAAWIVHIFYCLPIFVFYIFSGLTLMNIIIVLSHDKKKKKVKKHPLGYKSRIKQNLTKIRSKKTMLIVLGMIVIGMLFITGNNITGFVVGNANTISNNWNIFGFVLIIGVLGLLIFTYRKKIVEKIIIKRRKKYATNGLKGLIKKKVYTGEGYYVGKIEEVILGENKIDSLKIKFGNQSKIKKKLKYKGLIVKYKDVKGVGHIVIVDEGIENFLGELNI